VKRKFSSPTSTCSTLFKRFVIRNVQNWCTDNSNYPYSIWCVPTSCRAESVNTVTLCELIFQDKTNKWKYKIVLTWHAGSSSSVIRLIFKADKHNYPQLQQMNKQFWIVCSLSSFIYLHVCQTYNSVSDLPSTSLRAKQNLTIQYCLYQSQLLFIICYCPGPFQFTSRFNFLMSILLLSTHQSSSVANVKRHSPLGSLYIFRSTSELHN
jgi:hypothetical protein